MGGRIKVGGRIRSFPPHPNPLPCLRRSGFAQAGPRGEGRPFIPPAKLGGIVAYFDKDMWLSELTAQWFNFQRLRPAFAEAATRRQV